MYKAITFWVRLKINITSGSAVLPVDFTSTGEGCETPPEVDSRAGLGTD